VPPQQPLDTLTEGRVAGASPLKEGGALGRVFPLKGLNEDRLFLHGSAPPAGFRGYPFMRRSAGNCARSPGKKL
jgi:hypothetical protein